MWLICATGSVKFGIRSVPGILVVFALVIMCDISITYATEIDANLRVQLERIAQRRIYFGHQSVGVNLLDGIRQLATKAGVPIQIVEAKTVSYVGLATLGHTFVARNGDPFQKLRSFEQAMGQHSTGLDIALVKFCYVDINENTDVKALFSRYRNAIESLQARNPGTVFVHVTVPITAVRSGVKESLRQLLGRAPHGAIENIRREEYNTLLRQAYRNREPIFDLAHIEATTPDGTQATTEWQGSAAPAMASAYTDDGGHLNAIGKLRAARELVSVLAAISGHSAAGGAAP